MECVYVWGEEEVVLGSGDTAYSRLASPSTPGVFILVCVPLGKGGGLLPMPQSQRSADTH